MADKGKVNIGVNTMVALPEETNAHGSVLDLGIALNVVLVLTTLSRLVVFPATCSSAAPGLGLEVELVGGRRGSGLEDTRESEITK